MISFKACCYYMYELPGHAVSTDPVPLNLKTQHVSRHINH